MRDIQYIILRTSFVSTDKKNIEGVDDAFFAIINYFLRG